jgi:hypothetical protein
MPSLALRFILFFGLLILTACQNESVSIGQPLPLMPIVAITDPPDQIRVAASQSRIFLKATVKDATAYGEVTVASEGDEANPFFQTQVSIEEDRLSLLVPLINGSNIITARAMAPGKSEADSIKVFRAGPADLADLDLSLNWTDDQGDMDIHLLRLGQEIPPLFDLANDCHFRNCQPGMGEIDWGEAGNDNNDPILSDDLVSTPGNERISLFWPEARRYTIVVDAFSGRATCQVTLALGGQEFFFGPIQLDANEPTRQIWRVALIDWPTQTVIADNQLFSRQDFSYNASITK